MIISGVKMEYQVRYVDWDGTNISDGHCWYGIKDWVCYFVTGEW